MIWTDSPPADFELAIPVTEFDPARKTYTLPAVRFGDEFYCHWDQANLQVTAEVPTTLPFTSLGDCLNIPPCAPTPISLPAVAGTQCVQLNLSCGCCPQCSGLVSCPIVPSPSSHVCSQGNCTVMVNPQTGSVGVVFGGPDSDPLVPPTTVGIHSGPGNRKSGWAYQRVSEIDTRNVFLYRCDGSRQFYACKDEEGLYTPMGSISNNKLVKQDGWTETDPVGLVGNTSVAG